MTEDPHWARLAVFPAAFAADLARQRLEAEEIPVVVLNDQTGIFGPGFMGSSAIGVTLLVASDRTAEALELIDDLLENFDGEAAKD